MFRSHSRSFLMASILFGGALCAATTLSLTSPTFAGSMTPKEEGAFIMSGTIYATANCPDLALDKGKLRLLESHRGLDIDDLPEDVIHNTVTGVMLLSEMEQKYSRMTVCSRIRVQFGPDGEKVQGLIVDKP